MVANAFLVVIVLRIVKWELMSDTMHKEGKILFVHPVLVAVFVLQYAHEECLILK